MIFGAFERMVAARYLRAGARKASSRSSPFFRWSASLSGVATLIIVMAVMNGFRADIMDRILGVNGHLNIYGVTESILDYDAKAEQLKTIPGVVSVVPTVEGQVIATNESNAAGALVRGVKHEDLMAMKWISDHIIDGSLSPFITGEGIMIGSRMADRFNVKAGQDLTLISPRGNVAARLSVRRRAPMLSRWRASSMSA